MKTIKQLLTACAAIAALAFTVPDARAQQYTTTTLLSASTVSASVSSNYTASVTATKHDNVALQLSFIHAGAGTDNCTFTFERSVDGSTWDTANRYIFTVAANGNNTVTLCTNLDLGAVGYIRLRHITNGVAQSMTNITVKAATKPKKDG